MSRHASVSVKVLKDIDPKALDRLRQRLVGDNHVVNVGVPEGKREEDGTPVAMIAAVHEFGSPSQGIPERPFLRVAVQRNRQKYVRLNRINLVKMLRGQVTVDQALGQLGQAAALDVTKEIKTGNFDSLKPATIKARERKRSNRYNRALKKRAAEKGAAAGPIDKPLVDSGQLSASIAWELGDKNHD